LPFWPTISVKKTLATTTVIRKRVMPCARARLAVCGRNKARDADLQHFESAPDFCRNGDML
jgi:hypothetical protein